MTPGAWRHSLEIPYYVMNFKEEFPQHHVIDYFVEEYRKSDVHRIHVSPATVM